MTGSPRADGAARRRARRARVLRRPRHVGGGRVDAREGRRPVRLHRRPRPVRRARPRHGVPGPRQAVRRRAGAAGRLPRRARPRGPGRAAVRRLPHHAPPAGRTSTPRRSGGRSPARCSCGRCTTTASTSGATARTYKGNDIERFYRYGLLVNPNAADLQAVARRRRSSTELGGRAEMSEFLHRARPAVPRHAPRRRTRTDANIWGATHEAKSLEELDTAMDIVEPIMGVAPLGPDAWRSPPRTVTVALRGGLAGGDQRRRRSTSRSSWCMEANAIGGRHGLGMSDQIENRIIEAKSRGIYEAPGTGAAAHRLRAAGHRRSTTRPRSRTTARWAAASAGCCTRAAGSTRRA